MNQSQLNTLTMFNSFIAFMDNNQPVWEEFSPAMAHYNSFKNIADQLGSVGVTQQFSSTKSATERKKLKKEALATQAYKLCLKVKGYAKMKMDAELAGRVNFTEYQLKSQPNIILINSSEGIYQIANDVKEDAKDYKITDEQLASFQNLIHDFKAAVIKRDQVGDTRTLATLDLSNMIKNSLNILTDLDESVISMIEDPTFIAAYQQARKITDTRSRSKKTEKDPPKEGEQSSTPAEK